MEHQDFVYKSQKISLAHLGQRSYEFSWKNPEDIEEKYVVWLRYSNHCYSRELNQGEEQQADHFVVASAPRVRVYCPDRYDQTQRLVQMMAVLFQKPTSRVSLTHENNWTTFQLYLPPEGGDKQRYCAFFRVKNSAQQPNEDNRHFLDIHVESAYVRTNLVQTKRACPFGHVAYMTKNQIAYF